jgi:hypothetical protein
MPPCYRRSHPRTYAHAIMKNTTVITTNITSAIRLLLKIGSCVITSQAQCQLLHSKTLAFQNKLMDGRLQLARTKHRTVASCRTSPTQVPVSPPKKNLQHVRRPAKNARGQYQLAGCFSRVRDEAVDAGTCCAPIGLLYGSRKDRVEISSCVGIPTLALAKSLHRVTCDTQKTQRTLQ